MNMRSPGGMRGVPLLLEFVRIRHKLVQSRPAPPTGGGGFKRSAHSAGPRSFSKQCCLKVASVKLLARWRSHRFFFSRVGTFGCRFRCLLGAFGDPRAALGVAWGSFGGPLGAFFGVFGTPLGSPGSLFWGLWDSFGVPWVPQGPKQDQGKTKQDQSKTKARPKQDQSKASGKIREILGPILRSFWDNFS